MKKTEQTDMEKNVLATMEQAEKECAGFCAAVPVMVLGGLYGLHVDPTASAMGLGIRGDDLHAAGIGVSLFIAFSGQRQGTAKPHIIALCEKWQRHYAQNVEGGGIGSTLDAVMAGYHFISANRRKLGLGEAAPKPEQYYDNIYTDREAMFKHSPYALEERLSKAVTRGDEASSLAALREINAHGEKATLAKNPLRSVKNSMIGSIAFLSRAAIQAGVSANEAFALSDALSQQVEEMGERNAVLDFEEAILLQFIALVRQRLEETYTAPIVKVMHYIENHLDATVHLADAAAYAQVHPSYLSSLFNRETGTSFTAYVMTRKIQESSYFVRHTRYSISQIASLYGFSGQSYYITNFKKVMGSTPTEYRRQYLAE